MLIVNSFPKSGTNLLRAMMSPPLRADGHFGMFNGQTGERYSDLVIGQHLLHLPARNDVFQTSHLHWSSSFQDVMGSNKMILLLRDPRDVIVSHAYYIANSPSHHLHKIYRQYDHEQRIWTSMVGGAGGDNFPDIAQRLLPYLGWGWWPGCKVMFFESIVQDPWRSAREILEYCEIEANDLVIQEMVDKVGAGSSTFRKGKIGEWKEEFTEEQKEFYNAHFQWIHKLVWRNAQHEWD